jgi:mannose-6-phosphate isomerase-like protein (cupin superfamily)
MTGYTHVRSAVRIKVPGDKLIEELFGTVSTGTSHFSIAHMVAPAGWGEPAQTPDFLEVTVMVRGHLRVEIGGDVLEVSSGEAVLVSPGMRVRYSNPFTDSCEYYAFCLPAFAPETVHRES